jgi:hypothetical protein
MSVPIPDDPLAVQTQHLWLYQRVINCLAKLAELFENHKVNPFQIFIDLTAVGAHIDCLSLPH